MIYCALIMFMLHYDMIRYFDMHSKADISQLNLIYCTEPKTEKVQNRKTKK